MGLAMHERRAITDVVAKRYQKVPKKHRSQILDEFVAVMGYRRSYAAYLLANWKRRRVFTIGGVRTIYVFGLKRKRHHPQPPKRPGHLHGEGSQSLEAPLGTGWGPLWQASGCVHS